MATTTPPIPSNAGLSPMEQLAQWKRWRDSVDPSTSTLSGDEAKYYNGPNPRPGDPRFTSAEGAYSSSFSPEAEQMFVNAKTHFDTNSGKVTKNKGFMDLPESKWILAMAAAAGAGIAAPAIAGAFGAGAAGGGSAAVPTTMGIESATSLGLPVTAGLGTAGTATAAATGATTLGKVAGLLKGKGGDLLGAAGEGVGSATNAAAQNRFTSGQIAQQANNSYEAQMLNRAKEEQSQRNDALKQQYYANYQQNRKPGPFNTAGLTAYGPDMQETAKALAAQAKAKLANAAQYDTNGLPKLQTPDEFMAKYGNPSTLEKVGNWLSPTLSTLGKVSRYF